MLASNGTSRAGHENRTGCGSAGGSGKVTDGGSGATDGRGIRFTRRWPAPSGRQAATGSVTSSAASSVEPRRSGVPGGACAQVPGRTGRPAMVVPLADPRSRSRRPCGPTSSSACSRLTSGSFSRTCWSTARPIRCLPGASGNTCPAAGPVRTCSSSSAGRGSAPGCRSGVASNSAPSSSGGRPSGLAGSI